MQIEILYMYEALGMNSRKQSEGALFLVSFLTSCLHSHIRYKVSESRTVIVFITPVLTKRQARGRDEGPWVVAVR